MTRKQNRSGGRAIYLEKKKAKRARNRQRYQNFMRSKLEKNGWIYDENIHTVSQGNDGEGVSLENACKIDNHARKLQRNPEIIAESLKVSGWTQSGPNGEVWSIDGLKGDKVYATLLQAKNLQWKFESKAKAASAA